MPEQPPNIAGKRIMCHNEGVIHSDDAPVKIFYRDERIVTVFPNENLASKYSKKSEGDTVIDSDYKIDLKTIAGLHCEEYKLTFHHIPENKIEEYQNDPAESWIHGLYHFINYVVSGWVEVKEHNELSFYDAIYSESEDD